MELTEKDKKIITVIHEARLVNGDLLAEHKKYIKKFTSLDEKEIKEKINRFLKKGIIEKIKLNENDFQYFVKSEYQELRDKELEKKSPRGRKEDNNKRLFGG